MKAKSAIGLALLLSVLLVTGCGQTERTFEPGNLAFMGSRGVESATLQEQKRCADLWNRSDMEWSGKGQASVAMRNGGCLITFHGTGLLSGGLFACEERRGVIRCPSHGISLEYLHFRFHLRPFRLVWNATVDRFGHLALNERR